MLPMSTQFLEIAGQPCAVFDSEGAMIRDPKDGRDLIEDTMNLGARVIIVPASRLDASFFELRTGLAGELLQKAANYGFKFAIVGDISEHVAASDALRDFVYECAHGDSIFFEPDMEGLEARLARLPQPTPN